jgi:hypothetical protein
MPNSNNVYAELFANVTAFNVTEIRTHLATMDRHGLNKMKVSIFKLGPQFDKALTWYNSAEGQSEMDESGAHFNDVEQFCVSFAGKSKGWVYKCRKAFLFCEANEDALDAFLKYLKRNKEEGFASETSLSVEMFNKWTANECPPVFVPTAEAEPTASESESADAEEGETEESESGTFITISMKAVTGNRGATIRIDMEGNVLQADGDLSALKSSIGEIYRTALSEH